MTLLFIDGFDHYAIASGNDLAQKWALNSFYGGFGGGDTITTTTGRVTGNALQLNRGVGGGNSLVVLMHGIGGNYANLTVGFAYRSGGTTSSGGLCQFWDTPGTPQLTIATTSTYAVNVVRGNYTGTVLGTSAINVIKQNAWQFIEIHAIFGSGTGGLVVVSIDGTTVLNLTGQNTISSANAYANQVSVFGPDITGAQGLAANPGIFDDFYLIDASTGTGSSGFIGDHRVLTQFPTGNSGDTSGHDQWTQVGGTAGNFWTSVNDNPHDSDTSYVYSATPNNIESFTHAALPANTTAITAVQWNIEARKDDTGTRTIAPTQRNGSTDSVGTTSAALSTVYQNIMSLNENSLQTSTAWGVSEWNSSEFGVKQIS